MLLNNKCAKDLSAMSAPKTTNFTNSSDNVLKGSSLILRKLRYKTGKLNINSLPCTFKEKKGLSDVSVNSIQRQDIDSDDSMSCDDPGISQNKAQVDDKKSLSKRKQKGFSCSVCGHVASSSERLKEHLSRHSGMKHLQCDICGKKFAWRYSFKSHMASHMENNPNKCTVCGKKYSNKSAVKNHVLRIHGNPSKNFKCEKCEKAFVTKAELNRHSFNHSKEKPFVCEYCGNSYRFKGALLVHYKIHSGEKPYKCGFCDKEFLHLSSVIGHRRRHTGEKPYQCKECGKSFHMKRAMTSHMSVHSEEGKFKCTDCAKTFKSRSGYRVHLDFHLGIKRHACKYCGRTFRAWCNMNKHMKRHMNEKPQRCELCDKIVADKQELKTHMKSHNDNSPKHKKNLVNHSIITSCSEIIPAPTLTNSSCNIESSVFGNTAHNDIIPHIDLTDSQAIYDCNISNAIDKCPADKCQLLQDNYVSQFLYPQHPPLQYVPQSVPMQNLYSTDHEQNPQRSACLTNMNSTNFNCVQLSNQSFNTFSYNLSNSDELLSKCKLCRSLFHSTLVLRSHLLDYHRIDEENVDDLLT